MMAKIIKSDKVKTVANVSYLSLFRFATKWDASLILVSVIASSLAGLITPFAITLVADIFQTMIAYEVSVLNQTNDPTKFLQAMDTFGVNYSLVGVAMFVGGYLGSALINVAAINQIFRIRQEYLKAALNQDAAYFDQYETGDFASKMSDDVLKLEQGIGEKLSTFMHNMTVAVACILMALVKGWKLALLCLTTAPFSFLLVGAAGVLSNHLYKKEAVQTGLASSVAEEAIGSIRTVHAFNGQKKELEKYSQPLAKARKINFQKDVCAGLSQGFLMFCIFGSYALSFYFGIHLIVNEPETYNADVMFAVFFGVMTGLGNFGMVAELVSTFGYARGAAAQIWHLVDNVPTINPVLDRGLKPDTVYGDIEFQNVVFHYPTRPEITSLKNVSLKVRRGQSVALVGPSGCGKSTIIQLICRYYDVVGGSVTVDGHDVRELSVRWLRAQVGLVGQEPVLFNCSVRDNIRYGRELASDADVERAARQANAHHFILKLPQGYDTLVGERGASLSGGQKQRVAIARALVRNPSILLLDEATSALDTASEAIVQTALEKASENRTTLIVAHRLSTIRNVDLIYVLKAGVVLETGSHEQLVERKGLYYDMLLLQGSLKIEKGAVTTAKESENVDDSVDTDKNKTEGSLEIEKGTMTTAKESENIDDSIDTDQTEIIQEKEEEVSQISFWKVLTLNAPEWKLIVVGCVFGLVMGSSMPLLIVVFGNLFGSMSDPDPNIMVETVSEVSQLCIVIGVIIGSASFLETVLFGVVGTRLTERLRLLMFAHLLRQQMSFFDRRCNSAGALCARLSAEAAHVQGATGQRISILIQSAGCVGISVLLAMMYEWRVGLVALSFVPFVVAVIYCQNSVIVRQAARNAKIVEDSTQIAIEAVSNVRTVAAMGREPALLREYAARLAQAQAPQRRAAVFGGVVAGLSRSLFNFVNAAALTYGGHRIVSDGIAYQDILVTTQSLQMASMHLQNSFTFAPDFQKGVAAAARVLALLRTRPTIEDPRHVTHEGYKAKGDLTFKDVKFAFPTRPGVRVLQGLNLQVDRFKTIAVVGQSGCGKSTVIQLLMRYYDPDAGVVALDGIPLPELLLSDLRFNYGLVSQEPVLFDLSIAQNIAYGDNAREVPQDDIVAAAKQANIHDFVVSLPEGYETNIGKKGTQLSGGQKQRVAIARALVRRPRVLLLDEATSALDTASEKVVQEALDAAKAGRTCVMIAHRLSTVRDADAICVVHGGRVAEQGTHQQLMDLKKLYYNMHLKTQ